MSWYSRRRPTITSGLDAPVQPGRDEIDPGESVILELLDPLREVLDVGHLLP